MQNGKTFKLAVVGLGIAMNMIGAFIALNLKLPIYLDSIGTLMIAFLLGPKYGVLTGLAGSIVSGMTFDIYSLYFAPVQIFTGYLGGIFYKKGLFKGFKIPIGVFIMTIFVSLTGAVIAAYLFGGITSSGSSYIVVFLSNLGINKVASVFVVQFFTDYMDKLVAVILVLGILTRIPNEIKKKMEWI